MTEPTLPPPGLDAHLPDAMARRAEAQGVEKAQRELLPLLALSVLAGAFIAFGALLSTIAGVGSADLPYGAARILMGLVFSLGLILVVVGGAELFTGDVLMVMAWASRRLSLLVMLRVWALVFFGNAVGAIGTAILVFLSGEHTFGGGAVGEAALISADAKAGLPVFRAFMLGILANVLVCLAIWASLGARSMTDKVAVVIPPITAFVAAGFEHSIANLYFIPYGLMVKTWASPAFWAMIEGTAPEFGALTLVGFATNTVAVTLGNIVGGGVFVAAIYWFIYLSGSARR